MPYVEKEIERLYFKPLEVATQLGVAQSCLRFWEDSFGLKIKRYWKGPLQLRRYTKEDIIRFINIQQALIFFSVKGLQMMDLDYLDVTLDAIKENVKDKYFKKECTPTLATE